MVTTNNNSDRWAYSSGNNLDSEAVVQKNKKADTELKRLKKLAKEDWPVSVQLAIQARLSKRYKRIIVLGILWGIFFMGLALINTKLSEDWT